MILRRDFGYKKRGAYCILEGVAKAGRRLLAGCRIVYLEKGGGYCILVGIFEWDFGFCFSGDFWGKNEFN